MGVLELNGWQSDKLEDIGSLSNLSFSVLLNFSVPVWEMTHKYERQINKAMEAKKTLSIFPGKEVGYFLIKEAFKHQLLTP